MEVMETHSDLGGEAEAALGAFDLSAFEEQLLLAARKVSALCSALRSTSNDSNLSRSDSLYLVH